MTSPILRVLISPRQSDPRIWVAQCLETGFVTTGVGHDEAQEGILEVLRTETAYAQENGVALARVSPIPAELEQEWELVTRDHPPQTFQLFPPERKPPSRVGGIKQVEVARAR